MPTFARLDLEILSQVHHVRALDFPGPHRGWVKVVRHLPALRRGTQWADLTFCWFGKLHAFFAVLYSRLVGTKCAVVISGGEVCRFAFDGGRYRSISTHPLKRWFPWYVTRAADLLLPVSKYVYREAIQGLGVEPARMTLIRHGFDTEVFRRTPNVQKLRAAVTVGDVMDENLYHKRLATFLSAATFAPDVSFALIGPDKDGTREFLSAQLPPNAAMLGGLYGDDLIQQLGRASVYVQPSTWESFGCAAAEAMACECVPVVTRIPALEEVVDGCGVYLQDPVTPREIADKVCAALDMPELGRSARDRIIEQFSLERRRTELLEAVDSLNGGLGGNASRSR
jgi:glycosyltransferase involved in cell wall biosynthesis